MNRLDQRAWPLAAVLGVLLATFGCKDEEERAPAMVAPSASHQPRPASDQVEEIAVGDAVIVESGMADFWSGKVTKVDGKTVTYEYGSNRSLGESEKARVYVLAPNRSTAAGQDDVAVCKTGPTSWMACEIKRVERGVYVVEDPWGKPHNLSANEVVWPNEACRERIKSKLQKEAKNREFVNAGKSAGNPRRPDGWTPRPGDEIVARFTDSSWYGGRIRRVTPTKVHIMWDDKSTPSERNHDEVAPKPKEACEVREGQYVLARPRRGTRWDYHRVESVDDKGVVLVDQEGRKRKVDKSDLIPLGT